MINNKINNYSTLSMYGTNGEVQKIINPKPATIIPEIFYNFKPHTLNLPKYIPVETNCKPYLNTNQLKMC